MLLVGETRHGVVRLRFEPRPHDAPLGGGGEHRQARARDQIVDERGQEYRLAGARQAGDAEAQRPAGEIIADRAGDESRLEHEIAETWQGKFRVRKPGSLFRRRPPVWTVGFSPRRPRTPRASDRARAIPNCARRPSSGERKNRARLRRRSDIWRRGGASPSARPTRSAPSPARQVPGCGRRGRRARASFERARVRASKLAQTRVIEPRLFTELDLARPLGGKNLRRLLGASGAGMNQTVGQHAAGGQRRGDPPGVGAAAIGQPALVVVAPDGRLSLGVTNEKQPAHERRLRKPAGIGKRRRRRRPLLALRACASPSGVPETTSWRPAAHSQLRTRRPSRIATVLRAGGLTNAG